MSSPLPEYLDRSQDPASLARLEALVTRLADAELARPLDDGWTISGMLGHMAFWDRRVAFLFQRWLTSAPAPSDDLDDADMVNEAAKPQWLALAPRAAADEAVAAARAADAAVDAASPQLIEQIIAAGPPISLARAHHRLEHLEQIERALSE